MQYVTGEFETTLRECRTQFSTSNFFKVVQENGWASTFPYSEFTEEKCKESFYRL